MPSMENLWDATSDFFNSLVSGFGKLVTGLFGSSNARVVKKLQSKVDAINALEETYVAFSDEQLREKTEQFKQRIKKGETTDDLMIEAFAVCREGGKRFLAMRHYDVQMIGGMVLHSGAVAEMVTGEGKTLVATSANLFERSRRSWRSRRHGQRLFGSSRHGMDGSFVHGFGPVCRRDSKRHACFGKTRSV